MKNLTIRRISFEDLLTGFSLILTLFLAGEYRLIGLLGFALLIIINVISSLNKGWRLNLKSKLNVSILLNIAYLAVHMISSLIFQQVYEGTLYSYLMQVMIYSYLLILIGQNKSSLEVTNISKVFSYFFYCILAYLYIIDFEKLEYSKMFEFQLGILMLPAICFFILSKKNKNMNMFIFIVTAATIYLSTRRGSLLAFIAFILTFLIWQNLTKSKKMYKVYIVIFTISCVIIPFVYLSLSEPGSKLGSMLNMITIKYTGSRLFSGRDMLWPYVIEIIKNNPIWGAGVGVNLYKFYGINLSTHNLFFFILMQTGLIGLLLFCYMIYCFWMEYYKNHYKYSRIFGSLLVAILIQQVFSLGLLSGKMALALPVWTLISFGTYEVNEKIH